MHRVDLKREPKPEYENKTFQPPPMLPNQITDGLAQVGRGDQPPDGASNAKPDRPDSGKPAGDASPKPEPAPKPSGDRKEQLRAEAFSRAIEGAGTIEEARAIAGRFRVTREHCGANADGGGGFQSGNTCGDDEGDGPNADDPKGKQTDSPEFKKWFGDSKVVDADGKPMRLYHGTLSEFDAFDKELQKSRYPFSFGLHFTDRPSEASAYAKDDVDPKAEYPQGGNVKPVFLKAEKPLVITTKHPTASMEADFNRAPIIAKLVEAMDAGTPYDSVIIRTENKDEWGGSNVIVFKPSQIKSATGNSGKFDPNSDKITEGRWVTLNGGNDGGTRVYIDGDGEVKAGPAGLKGKDLDEKPSGGASEPKKPLGKPATGKKSTGLVAGDSGRTVATKAKKLDISQAEAMLKERGYELGKPQTDLKSKKTIYPVSKDGETVYVSANELIKFLKLDAAELPPGSSLKLFSESVRSK